MGTSAAAAISHALEGEYPAAACSLHFKDPFQLLVATILSAQCTDERVNQVTPVLFKRCPTPCALASMAPDEVEGIIRSTGFYRNKARSLLGAARMICEEFAGEVPARMEDLLRLPGVARKTANVVLGNAFGKTEGFVVDTHVRRLALRMGLTVSEDPEGIERDLTRQFPRDEWTPLGHRLIHHGRKVCTARKPACGRCAVGKLCPRVGV